MYKTVIKVFSFLFVTLFAANLVFSQSYNTQFYNESNGLFNSKIWDILQDRSGRMWFGTRSGISVYDGISWSGFINTDSIGRYECFALRMDDDGNIKALFRNPSFFVATYTKDGWKRLPPSGFITGNEICSFFTTGRGDNEKVYICTENDGIIWHGNDAWKTLLLNEEYGIDIVYSACPLGDSVLISTNKGLYFWNTAGTFRSADIAFPSKPRGLYTQKEFGNKIYAAGEDWFGYLENDSVKILSEKLTSNFDFNVLSLRIEPDNNSGFYIFNYFTLNYFSLKDSSVTRLRSKSGLITDGATCVFTDRENNAWIGSPRGANKISSRRFINYLDLFGEGEGEVSAIMEYEPGKIIFGGNNGYTMFDGEKFRHFPIPDPNRSRSEKERILDFQLDTKGNIWVASTTNGFFLIDKTGKKLNYKLDIPVKERATSVIMDKDKNLWFVTNGNVYIHNDAGTKIYTDIPKNHVIRKAFNLGDSTLGFTTVLEGFYLRRGNVTTHYMGQTKEGNSVFTLEKDRKGKIWIGTLAGLFELNGEKVQRAILNDGDSVARPVYLLMEDRSGNLWIGTDFGVYKYNGSIVRKYSTKDGLSGNELNRAGGVIEKNGRIWFGTNFGASCYYEELDNNGTNETALLLKINRITSSGISYASDADISLSENSNDISFIISGCSFINEKENRISWKLDGEDKEWKKEVLYQSNEIYYNNLAPGDYRLHVRMRNSDGVLGPETVSSVITIEKPFYLKWWFLAASAMLIAAIAYSGQNYYSQRKYNRFLQEEVNKVTAELTEAEKTYRETLLKEIHHRIKNNLQVVSSLLSLHGNTVRDEEINEILRESRNRIRSMAMIHEKLYSSKSYSSLNISSYVKSLVDYLARSYLSNTSQVKIETQIPELFLNIDISVAIGLIVNELVSNALKYAFPGNRKGTISISINQADGNNIAIGLKDDGVGLDKEPIPENMETLGLRLVNMLVKQYDGKMETDITRGTSFNITLKYRQETSSPARG
ncbi:MAG: ATP-binding protein [Bacteroidetes bacterium]|nr:ATP-binding protein [Bacteroidota bacterium]